MSQNIANLFIKDYDPKAKQAYQQMGKNLAQDCRLRTKVVGKDTTFPVIGTTSSGTKARGAEITASNATMEQVTCPMTNQYHRFDVEDLDTYKTNVEEQMELAIAAANAMKRWEDSLIINAVNDNSSVTHLAADNNVNLNLELVKELTVKAGQAHLFEDGIAPPIALVGDSQWSELLEIDEFSRAEWVGADKKELPNTFAGQRRMKMWRGVKWCVYSSLPYDSTNKRRTCLFWTKNAVGAARQKAITINSQYYNTTDNLVVTHKAALGAVVIDAAGAYKFSAKEA